MTGDGGQPWRETQPAAQECVALRQVMEAQGQLLARALALELEKSRVLVAGDVGGLNAITAAQQRLALELERMETDRCQRQAALEQGLGPGLAGVPFSELALRVPEPERCRIEALRRRMRQTAAELGDVRKLNAMLLDQAKAYVQYMLRVIEAAPAGVALYSPGGNVSHREGTSRAHRIDSRA